MLTGKVGGESLLRLEGIHVGALMRDPLPVARFRQARLKRETGNGQRTTHQRGFRPLGPRTVHLDVRSPVPTLWDRAS